MLMENPQLRATMGAEGRRVAQGELGRAVFEEEVSRIVNDLYRGPTPSQWLRADPPVKAHPIPFTWTAW